MALGGGKSQTLKYTLKSRNVLSLEETELYELTQLAGVLMDPNVFKIILDLLKMNVNPTAVSQMLNSLSGQRRKKGEQLLLESARGPRSHDTNGASSANHGNKQQLNSKGRQPTSRSANRF